MLKAKEFIKKVGIALLALNIFLVLHIESYAIVFHGNVIKNNNYSLVPYGKILSIEQNETVTTNNSSIADISNGMVTIKGTGYFDLTSTTSVGTESLELFAWNAYLKKGIYYTYKDSSLSEISGYIKSPTYLSVERDATTNTLKILDVYPSEQKGEIKNTYIKSFYNSSSDSSTSYYFNYSFTMDNVVETPAVEPTPSGENGGQQGETSQGSEGGSQQSGGNNGQSESGSQSSSSSSSSASKPEFKHTISGTKKKSYKNSSISVKIEKISGCYVAKIWVKDPSKQIGRKMAGWQSSVKQAATMLNSTNNAIVGINGSGFYVPGSWEPDSVIKKLGKSKWKYTTEGYLVIYNGKVLRKISGKKCNAILGILKNGSLKYYENNSYNDPINDGVYNTINFGPLMIKNGKAYKQRSGKVRMGYTSTNQRTCFGQVDSNNYIFIVGKKSLNQLASLGLKLHCNTLYNCDGGGSSSMWFRGKKSGNGSYVKSSSRRIEDVIYFKSLSS